MDLVEDLQEEVVLPVIGNMKLKDPVTKVKNVSNAYAEKLKRLDIETVGDLLFHIPRRYNDFSQIIAINKLENGEDSCVRGTIKSVKNRKAFGKMVPRTTATIQDSSGLVRAVWFNQPWMKRNIQEDEEVILVGETRIDNDGLFLSNPSYEKVKDGPQIHSARVVPIYPETEGLTSRWLRYVIHPLLKTMLPKIPETLPSNVIEENNLFSLKKALGQIHFPNSIEMAQEAKRRLAFEELFLLQLFLIKQRRNRKEAVPVPINKDVLKEFGESLPFQLTDAQRRESWRIIKEMSTPKPMFRLLQGDVGSGKTVVATIALLNTAQAGYQSALMVPTEILAQQHFEELKKLLEPFDVSVELLTGTQKTTSYEKIKQGEPQVIVGTHALIQEKVSFKNIALTIIDEQHRFGVKQRAKLKEKGRVPHLLTMTATPIPRSLALTAYGHLDISLLDELPKNRGKITTELVTTEEERERAYSFLQEKRAFVVCPRISENTEGKSVEEVSKDLRKRLPSLNIEKLHGQMENKDKLIKGFREGEIDVLVTTSVIEVGVDIPQATMMIVQEADRFGLSQLHQIRGRVGRSSADSRCFLFTENKDAIERLEILVSSQDGFEIAEQDLKIRGPGVLTGYEQTGIPPLKVADLQDIQLIKEARYSAQKTKIGPKLKKRLKRFSPSPRIITYS